MRIVDVKAFAVRIPLVEEFRIALGASKFHEGVILKLLTDEDITGYGEAVPSSRITGETIETVMGLLSRIRKRIIGLDPLAYNETLEQIDKMVLGNPSAKAAIDIAIHDVVGKAYGVPLCRFLGHGSLNSFETSVTIGIMDKDSSVRKALSLVEKGISIIKVKIGLNPLEDIYRVKAIRKAVGDDIRIRLDANQGYTVKQAVRVLRSLEPLDIEFCEQPVHWRDLDGMREVRKMTEIPIMADESVHSPTDVIEIIKHDAADMVNIKLMKSGGIRNAIKIANICESAGLLCQIGCMSETRIAISAGLHLAIALDIIKFSDLDGYILLSEDFASGVSLRGTCNFISDKPGLGITVNTKILEKYVVARI